MFKTFQQKAVQKRVETKNTPTSGDPKLTGFGRLTISTFPWYVWLSVTPKFGEMTGQKVKKVGEIK